MAKAPQTFDRVNSLALHLSYLAALAPAVAAACWSQGWPAVLLFALSGLSAWGADELQRLWRQDRSRRDLSAVLWGLLLAFLLPGDAPPLLAVVGPALAVLGLKGLLGGGSTPWLNPVLAAWAFLVAAWPGAFHALAPVTADNRSILDQQVLEWLNNNVFSWVSIQVPGGYFDLIAGLGRPAGAILAESATFWLLAATVYLLAKGYLPWIVPAAFFGAFLVPQFLTSGDLLAQVFRGGLLLNLFFLAGDPSGRPLGRITLAVYAAGAGLLSFLTRVWGLAPDGVGFAVLLMNLFVPWIDRTWRRRSLNDFRAAW